MIRRLTAAVLSVLSVLSVVAIWPAVSRAADSVGAVHAVIDRVELAAVTDDPGACAVMGTAVRQAYIQGAEVTSGARSPVGSCAAAVRDDHAGYRHNREMAAERTAQQAVVRAFAAGTVSFSTHGRDATAVAHLTTRQFLGDVRSRITAKLTDGASGWKVLSVVQHPSGSTAPPPPII